MATAWGGDPPPVEEKDATARTDECEDNQSCFLNAKACYDTSTVPSILVSGIAIQDTMAGAMAARDMGGEREAGDDVMMGSEDQTAFSVIHHPHLAAELLAVLNAMREAGDMTDARLTIEERKAGGLSMPCHLAVVCAGSPLLQKLLQETYAGDQMRIDKNQTLEVPNMRAEILQIMVDFIYTSKMQISNRTAQELLQLCFAKTPFHGKSVEFACSEFLVGHITVPETESETSSTSAITSSGLSTEDDVQSWQSSSFSTGQETSFHEYNYPLEILHALDVQRRKGDGLTDLVLCVEGQSFPCHRCILVALSPYFRAMFTSDMKEFSQKTVTLSNVRADIFRRLLNFIYTCKLRINEDEAQIMLETACFLQLTPVIGACSQFLKENMIPQNCLGFLRFAQLYACCQLYDDATACALLNFKEIVSYEEFLDLPADILAIYISDDGLNVKTEETVFEAVMKWVRVDVDHRASDLPKVLANVRLPLIDPVYFRKFVEKEELLLRCKKCQDLLSRARRLRELSGRGQHIDDPNLKLRSSMTTQVIVIVGGYDDSQKWVRDVWCFNLRDETWHSLAPFPGRNQRFATVAVDNDIYVIGGQAEHGPSMSETLSDVWRYDSITDTWGKVAGMNKPRHGHGAAVVGGKIYVVGGKMGWAKKFNDIERYDPTLNIWACVTRIKGSYLEKPVATSHGGKLYVNGYFYRDPDILNCYDPHDSSWTAMYNFQRAYGDAIETAVVLDEFVYFLVYRGYDNYIVIFNPVTCERVRGGCKMPDGKYLYSYGATVLGDKIFVAGGSKLDASINVSYIQCYDPALDMWGVVGTMPHPLCEHGCVTIEKYMPPSQP